MSANNEQLSSGMFLINVDKKYVKYIKDRVDSWSVYTPAFYYNELNKRYVTLFVLIGSKFWIKPMQCWELYEPGQHFPHRITSP